MQIASLARIHSLPLVAWALFATCPSLALAQDLPGRVRAFVQQTTGSQLELVYDQAAQLADLAPENNPDTFRDAVMAAATDAPRDRLLAALALREAKADPTGKDVLHLLTPLATSDDGALRAAAMAVFADDRLFNARLLPDVTKLVTANVSDELAPPTVRIEASLALWNLGTTSDARALAKRTLEQFLQSRDRDLQQRGALALAEINIEGGPAWQILRQIQDEPTEHGRRARLYLKREEQRREFAEMAGRLIERAGGSGTAPTERSQYDMLTELRGRIHTQHIRGREVSDKELVEFAAKGMLQGLDQHSVFFTSEEYQRFFFDLNREYGGIGAFVNFDQDGDFSIIRPIYSGPAYHAGLRSGDKILEVDQWETAGHTTDEIIARLKGQPGTPVELKFFRPGLTEPQTISVARQQINVPAVNWAMVPGDVGYIELINFSSNISDELRTALADLTKRGAKAIVLDVRNNTGGFLTQARDVVEQFLDGEKLVVYTQGPAEPRRDYKTDGSPRPVCKLPLAVLENNFSASASEITAGALQDHGRAVIIGQRSYGKGSVQNLFALKSDPAEEFVDANHDGVYEEGETYTDANKNGKYDFGGHMKLTVAKYHLPSGRCPHREYDKEGRIVDPSWGVIPDKVVDLLENKPEDAWKNSAVFALLKKNAFRDYVKKNLPGNKELFQQLAEGDDGDASRYPDFAAFYKGLDTKLSEDDVRRWIRYEVRDQISDLRGAVYPGQRALGDPQEDAQLQEAVRTLLGQIGTDIRSIAAYQHVLKIKFDGDEPAKSDKTRTSAK